MGSSELYSVDWNAILSATTSTLSVGQCYVRNNSTGGNDVATSANRGTKRASGIALTAADANNPSFVGLIKGPAPASTINLGAGAAGYVRVNASTAILERVASPSAADEVVGYCEADGSVYVDFGMPWGAIIAGAGGGGTPGGVNGDVQVNKFGAFSGVSPGASGNVLTSDGSQWNSTAPASGVTWAADLLGSTNSSQTVVAIHGATVPIAGALTTGNVLQVTGASALGYAAVNLAGGGNFVTGALPLGNQAAPTGTGFATVTAGAWDAAAAAYPIAFAKGGTGATSLAAGAVKSTGTALASAGLGTGLQVLRTNAGATDVEWATPSTFTAPTGTGLMTVTGGVMDAASLAFPLGVAKGGSGATTFSTGILHASGTSAFTSSLIVDADVSGGAAIQASKLAPPGSSTHVVYNGAGAFAANANLTHDGSGTLTAATAVRQGGGPASAGCFRGSTTGSGALLLAIRNAGNTGDINALSTDGSDNLILGATGAGGLGALNSTYHYSANTHYLVIGGTTKLRIDGSTINAVVPIIGDSAPYGVHGRQDINVGTNPGTYTLAPSEYQYTALKITTATTVFNLDLPTPSGRTNGYWKILVNGTTVTMTVRKAGGGGDTLQINAGNAQLVFVDSGGIHPFAPVMTSPAWN